MADGCSDTLVTTKQQGGSLQSVLRLLCLVSLTQGGIPKRQYDSLRRELLVQYGHQHLLTLTALHDAGVVNVPLVY